MMDESFKNQSAWRRLYSSIELVVVLVDQAPIPSPSLPIKYHITVVIDIDNWYATTPSLG